MGNVYVLGPEADSLGQACAEFNTAGDEFSGCKKDLAPRHNGGWNYGFVDGHVKWFKPSQIVGQGDEYTAKGYWTRTPGD